VKRNITFCLFSSALLAMSVAHAGDKLHLAGTYQCTGYDSYSGFYTGVVKLTLDPKASNVKQNYGAYSFSYSARVPGIKTPFNYAGEAAAHGDLLAIYYQNVNQKDDADDRGVGIATISRVQDAKGNFVVSFQKFYYEPKYLRDQTGPTGQAGGTGTETCVQQN